MKLFSNLEKSCIVPFDNNKILLLSILSLATANVEASSIIATRPSSGMAALKPGQTFYLRCEVFGVKDAQFRWYKRPIGEKTEDILLPNTDKNIVINNTRLTLLKPTLDMAGDYVCRILNEHTNEPTDPQEFGLIKVRARPYIEDFGLETSDAFKNNSLTMIYGDRLELTCTVRDKQTPVDIIWWRTGHVNNKTMTFQDVTLDEKEEYNPSRNVISFPLNSHSKKLIVRAVNESSKAYIFSRMKPSWAGKYTCEAYYVDADPSYKSIYINMEDKPSS